MAIPLGSKVKDNLTGLTGTAVICVHHLYGCNHVGILPAGLKDGHPQKVQLVDEQRVEIIENSYRQDRECRFKLGNKVKDKLTGFEGIVTTWEDELYDGPLVGVQPAAMHEGKPVQAIAFPQDRLQLIEDAAPVVSRDSTVTSGSMAERAQVLETARA